MISELERAIKWDLPPMLIRATVEMQTLIHIKKGSNYLCKTDFR
jgi:hypothetical protein